jgi:hypothetical protein
MNPIVKNYIAGTLVILGLICIARGVLGAERQGFQWALWMQLPGKPQEIAWLFDSETACSLDLASSANAAPKGTRFQCQRRK